MKIKTGIFFIILPLLSSCFNYHKSFVSYRDPIMDASSKVAIKTNGIYFIFDKRNNYVTTFLYFYSNGLVYTSPAFLTNKESNEFWSNPVNYISDIKKDFGNNWKPTDMWGNYEIKNDSIAIQFFFHNHENGIPRKRDIIELYGSIMNDTVFSLYKERCTWWYKCYHIGKYSPEGVIEYDPPFVYQYYKTDFKPDSSRAWFLKKRWYKRDLHESRK